MKLKNASMILISSLMLFACSAVAANYVIFVLDEYKMTVNNAEIYIDNSSQPIGTTTYDAGMGRNCWIGDINQTGLHTLSAKWARANPSQVPYEGSVSVDLIKDGEMRISIPTHKA